jgi:hypothetical protein
MCFLELVLRATYHKNKLLTQQEIVKNKFCEKYITEMGWKAADRQLTDLLIMRDFRLPPRCKWDIRSSGVLHRVVWYFVTDVSE